GGEEHGEDSGDEQHDIRSDLAGLELAPHPAERPGEHGGAVHQQAVHDPYIHDLPQDFARDPHDRPHDDRVVELVHVPLFPQDSAEAGLGWRQTRGQERLRSQDAGRARDAQPRDEHRSDHQGPLRGGRSLDPGTQLARRGGGGLEPTPQVSSATANAAPRISSFEKNPAKGGMPAIASVAIHMRGAVQGMERASPPIFRMSWASSCECVAWYAPCMAWITLPEPRNRRALKNAWVARWKMPAAYAPVPTPTNMYPSCETVEYASTRL